MKVGIVGLPNAGKSTLFNALTRGGAETGDYPFTTIDPNVAVVPVPDERLERVAETVGSSEVVLETIEFHDIAGLVRGASEGEGLGNRFLAAIRETDAICHVVRAHGDGRRAASGGPDRSRRRHRADRARAARRRPRAGPPPARARDQAGPVARQGGGRRAGLARGRGRNARGRPAGPRGPGSRRGAGRSAPPPGAHLEADPVRRERRRGLRRGAGGGRRARPGRGRHGRRDQRPDRVRAGRARRPARGRRSCAASWGSRSPGSSG